MNEQHAALLTRILEFEIDEPDTERSFAARLAAEQRWTADYAARAIVEYKRFVFLAMSGHSPVCPSDAVDEVWHLHLIYTRSYWQRLCQNVLEQPLHHDPSRGGILEQDKHNRMYARTLTRYREVFGVPPIDIWPDADARFASPGVAGSHAPFWIVPKPHWWLVARSRWAGAVGAALVPLMAWENPFDLRGKEFLTLFAVCVSIALLIGLVVRYLSRRAELDPVTPLPPLDSYEVAYLAGGAKLAANTALARLVSAEYLHISTDKPPRFQALKEFDSLAHPIERFVAETCVGKQPRSLGGLYRQCADRFDSPKEKLRDQRLLVSHGANWVGCGLPLGLMLSIVLFGLIKVSVGIERGRPVGFLVVMCIVTTVVSLLIFARPLFRTTAGDEYLASLRKQFQPLRLKVKSQPEVVPGDQLSMALGLWGLGLLATGPYAHIHRTFDRHSTWNSGSSGYFGGSCGGSGGSCGGGGGGGCGGGGCGGGGCGGCGGG